ncbi:hypothetical protein L484_024234 [Morus notabilis]|uniref:Uncharacterized protein n=1 Tax=Morus notabilis TaxID=981085 RepID=W9QS38_9ROSA|nr:hypothetical protein L484_024234 [Morus notabilis]
MKGEFYFPAARASTSSVDLDLGSKGIGVQEAVQQHTKKEGLECPNNSRPSKGIMNLSRSSLQGGEPLLLPVPRSLLSKSSSRCAVFFLSHFLIGISLFPVGL